MIVSSIIGFCAAPDRVGRVLCWLWWRGQWRCHRQFASNAAGCQGIDMMRYPSWEPDKSCAILPPPRFIYPLPFYCTALATIINSYMQGVQGNAHHQSTIKFVVIEVWLGQPWPQAAQDLQPRAALQVVSWYANWWITSMLWLPMEFTVCLLLHLFQSDLESNTEVLEKKKKNTLWAR